jgi:hypothetical protein
MAMGDTPLVINHTRGALCGGKCGERGREGFDDEGAVFVMTKMVPYTQTSRLSICYMYPGRNVCMRTDELRGGVASA